MRERPFQAISSEGGTRVTPCNIVVMRGLLRVPFHSNVDPSVHRGRRRSVRHDHESVFGEEEPGSSGQRFIISSLSDHSLFIKTDKEAYVRSLIDDWIDMNNTPKKEEENHGKGRK